ncbi:MAG: hypothetical protein ACKVVP_22800 [Chloroflexota bacterium]
MDVTHALRFTRLVAATVLISAAPFAVAWGQPQSANVRFAVMGNREIDGSITGETVQVHVPWDGVNLSESTVRCLVGPFQLRSDGSEEHARIGPDSAVILRLRLDSDEEGTWEVMQASGRCASLGGTGVFRRTLWADGTVSYRFIGAASISIPVAVS